jgi:Immunoglobulin-like domain of bacterial spore germination
MTKKTTIQISILIVLIIIALGLYAYRSSFESIQPTISTPVPETPVASVVKDTPPTQTSATSTTKAIYIPASAANEIRVTSPIVGATLHPNVPIKISGEALGRWYFEASFPIELTDAQGAIISKGVATAQSTWMVPGFVPFTGTLGYNQQRLGSRGYVILRRDNPSDFRVNDASIKIPVIFQ